MFLWIGKPSAGNKRELLFISRTLKEVGRALRHNRDGGFFFRSAGSRANFVCDRCGAQVLINVEDGLYLPAPLFVASVEWAPDYKPSSLSTEWGPSLSFDLIEGGASSDHIAKAAGTVGRSVSDDVS